MSQAIPSFPNKKERHCISIDCTSRRSLCCDAKSKLFNEKEGTSYYKCSTCGGEFIPREHSCVLVMDWRDIDKEQKKCKSKYGEYESCILNEGHEGFHTSITESSKKCNHCSCNEKDKSLKVFCPIHFTPTEITACRGCIKEKYGIGNEHTCPIPSPTKPVDMGIDCLCDVCKKRLCTCPEKNNDKSWTRPDTEEWEKEFDKLAQENIDDLVEGVYHKFPTKDKIIIVNNRLKSFIRQEKEKSYKEGLHKGYQEEAVGCHEHCEEARQSAYREILEMVEGMLPQTWFPEGALHIRRIALEEVLAKIKDKLSQK